MKLLFIATVLVVGNSSPQYEPVKSIHIASEPGIKIELQEQIPEIPQTQFALKERLEPVALPSAPIGTYTNPYPYGQCTYGVASMKPNIPAWGNANEWDDNARAAGYTVSNVPILGAVAVRNSGAFGHVAVVTAVFGDRIQITEMNYDFAGSVRTRDASVSEFVYIYI